MKKVVLLKRTQFNNFHITIFNMEIILVPPVAGFFFTSEGFNSVSNGYKLLTMQHSKAPYAIWGTSLGSSHVA